MKRSTDRSLMRMSLLKFDLESRSSSLLYHGGLVNVYLRNDFDRKSSTITFLYFTNCEWRKLKSFLFIQIRLQRSILSSSKNHTAAIIDKRWNTTSREVQILLKPSIFWKFPSPAMGRNRLVISKHKYCIRFFEICGVYHHVF